MAMEQVQMNKPVAYVNNMCNDSIDWKVDPMDLEEGTPLYTHPVKEQELLDEVTKLKWEINHREQDIDALKTKLNDVKYKYDIKTHQHIYTQVYVDELQAEIELLNAKLAYMFEQELKTARLNK